MISFVYGPSRRYFTCYMWNILEIDSLFTEKSLFEHCQDIGKIRAFLAVLFCGNFDTLCAKSVAYESLCGYFLAFKLLVHCLNILFEVLDVASNKIRGHDSLPMTKKPCTMLGVHACLTLIYINLHLLLPLFCDFCAL